MNEYQNLIKAYLKFRDGVKPLNEKDASLIATSKDELNRHFNREHLKAIDIINANLDKINQIDPNYRMDPNYGLSDYYLNSVYRDLLDFSFSSSGHPMGNEPRIDNVSKCKISQLIVMLNSLKETIVSKESATDIIDAIIDEFKKLKK